jgi:hypothetical protein
MDPLLAKFDDLKTAEGVVLIDEVDAHLHPRWKLRVVDSMRSAFPGLQFVATTHDPLCLRGVRAGEIRRMEVQDGRAAIHGDLPDPTNLSVEELLTSSAFGLITTKSSEAEARFDEYYDLLARAGELTADERARRDDLRKTIGRDGVLGRSPRDQRIYVIADEWLAFQRARGVRDLAPWEVREVAAQLVVATGGIEEVRRSRIHGALTAAFGDLDDGVPS